MSRSKCGGCRWWAYLHYPAIASIRVGVSPKVRLKAGLKGVLGWLLQTGLPVPARSEEEIAAEVERNYRWNFTVNLLEGASFVFGLSFASSTTILPLFISKLTTSTLAIGLLGVIAQGGWSLPQLFAANSVERLARKKPFVINLGFFLERMPMWLLVTAALIAERSASLALPIFLVSFAWFNLGAGVVAPAWQELIARCFPVERRGRLMGTTMFVGTSTGALGAVLSAWLLKTFPFPTNFVYTFIVAASGISLSWFLLSLTREPVQPISTPQLSNRQFWATLPDILRGDHNFRRFVMARLLIALGGMGTGFVTVVAVRRWQIPDSTVGAYTVAMLLGQSMGNLFFGWLADRLGHKFSLELGALTAFLAFALAGSATSAIWWYPVFALLGVTQGAIIVSGILVVLEFSGQERRPTYVGITNTGVGLVGGVAPLIGAWMANINSSWLFAFSAGVNLVAFIAMRWSVQEPRWVKEKPELKNP